MHNDVIFIVSLMKIGFNFECAKEIILVWRFNKI